MLESISGLQVDKPLIEETGQYILHDLSCTKAGQVVAIYQSK